MKAFLPLVFIYFIASPSVFGQEIGPPPEWMKTVTRIPPGKHANLRAVALEYTLDWNHRVNAGRVEISISRNEEAKGRFVGEAEGQSTGFARLLFPYDFRARSIVDQNSLRPVTFQLAERDRNEVNHYDIIFEKQRQIFTTTSTEKDKTHTLTGRFRFDYGQDVMSSAFYLRSLPLNDGDRVSLVVTPFNRPYLANFEVLGRENHKVKGKVYSTIKMSAEVGKVNPDLSIKSYEKVKRTTLWFSNDEYRIPLELQSQLSFGFVSARLDDLEWLE